MAEIFPLRPATPADRARAEQFARDFDRAWDAGDMERVYALVRATMVGGK